MELPFLESCESPMFESLFSLSAMRSSNMEMSNVSDSSRRGCVADWVVGGGVPVKSKRGGERDREEKEEINKASKGRGRISMSKDEQ